jgi:hypothetical protein
MEIVKAWLDEALLDAPPEVYPEKDQVLGANLPACMRSSVADLRCYLLPASLGLTLGYAFFSKVQRGGNECLVILSHGLGQSPCTSQWPWIHAFLKAGVHVLSVALDGHDGGPEAPLSQFDARQAARTLPLVLHKLRAHLPDSHGHRVEVYLCGTALGATYNLLAASRQEFRHWLKGVICVSPSLSAGGSRELRFQRPRLRRPLQLVRDGARLSPYYGLMGFRRIWSRPNENLRETQALGGSLEAQLQRFINEDIGTGEALTHVAAPVLWIQDDVRNSEKGSVVFKIMDKIPSPLIRYSDPHRSARSVQYSRVWPERAAEFVLLLAHKESSVTA